jgi:hypothetical protein
MGENRKFDASFYTHLWPELLAIMGAPILSSELRGAIAIGHSRALRH